MNEVGSGDLNGARVAVGLAGNLTEQPVTARPASASTTAGRSLDWLKSEKGK
jgi:hypothetical protein